MLKSLFRFCSAFLIIFFYIHDSYGIILDPAAMGVRALGMGGAVASIGDDPISAFYYNPSGLVRIKGTQYTMGIISGIVSSRYKDESGYDETNSHIPIIPVFGYTTDKYAPFFFGFGGYSTLAAGFLFDGDEKHPFYRISKDIKNLTGVFYLSPTVAYQINKRLSIGAELNIGYGLSQINAPTPLGYLKTDADGFGLGGTIGLTYSPVSKIRIALNWRSQMKTPLEGDSKLHTPFNNYKLKDDIRFCLYWPHMVTVGISYTPNPKIVLALDIKWSEWSRFDRSKITFEKLKFLQQPGVNPLVQDMRDCIRYQRGQSIFSGKTSVFVAVTFLTNMP